jgi:hypothetical protein
MVHSSLSGIPATMAALESSGFEAEIVTSQRVALGPVSRARVEHLVSLGQLDRADDFETLAVIEARKGS